jgi:hypothetical protein
MPNDLFKQMSQQNGGDPLMQNFTNFLNQMKGQNPRAIINQMVQSGQINQQQLNMAQQKAQQMSGIFGQFKSRFGF